MTLTSDRYPADLLVTEQDFRNSGWKDALLTAKHEGYPYMSTALCKAARQTADEGDQRRGKVLWLLADACSMMLKPDSVNEPFGPQWEMFGKRTPIPDDLSENDVAFYAKVVGEIDVPRLKARLADLVWLKQPKGGYPFALDAIDAYRSIALDKETWMFDGEECWGRAIQLARVLGKGAGDRIAQIESDALEAFDAATKHDAYFALRLSVLLASHGLGYARRETVARKLESLARQLDADGDLLESRVCFEGAAKWFAIADDRKKAAFMKVCVAENWVKQAEARQSNIAAATFYENAIQTYREIPRAERAAHGADKRLDELRARLAEAGEKSLDEMMQITGPGMDISHIADNARKKVSGKTPVEALRAFCHLSPGYNAKQAREEALKQLRSPSPQNFFAAVVKSRDGRTVAKRPGMDINDMSAEGNESAIMSKMIERHNIDVNLRVHGEILPALEVLWLEHRLHERDFVGVATQSPIVPKDRAYLFGKALFAGYDRDFVTALHLLVPQIENMVRYHLNQYGAETTTLDSNGIATEVGLSNLIDMPQAEEIFGADFCCETRMLFCDSSGANLRNNLAHGLLDDGECQSVAAVYAWWLGLRMVFHMFWKAHKAARDDNGEVRKE